MLLSLLNKIDLSLSTYFLGYFKNIFSIIMVDLLLNVHKERLLHIS